MQCLFQCFANSPKLGVMCKASPARLGQSSPIHPITFQVTIEMKQDQYRTSELPVKTSTSSWREGNLNTSKHVYNSWLHIESHFFFQQVFLPNTNVSTKLFVISEVPPTTGVVIKQYQHRQVQWRRIQDRRGIANKVVEEETLCCGLSTDSIQCYPCHNALFDIAPEPCGRASCRLLAR